VPSRSQRWRVYHARLIRCLLVHGRSLQERTAATVESNIDSLRCAPGFTPMTTPRWPAIATGFALLAIATTVAFPRSYARRTVSARPHA
jgi:hypothetical protein